MNKKIWEECQKKWQWVLDCVYNKGCDSSKIKISPPLSESNVIQFEKETGLMLPEDYKEMIINYSSSINFYWYLSKRECEMFDINDPIFKFRLERFQESLPKEEFERVKEKLIFELRRKSVWIDLPDEIKISLGGTGSGSLAQEDNEAILESYIDFQNIIEESKLYMKGYDDEIYKYFYVIMWESDGDYIVMDLKSTPTRILYLDHEFCYGPEGIVQIGTGFTDFLIRFSNLGCPGPNIYTLKKFLDPNKNILDDKCDLAKKWISWLNQK